MRFGACTKLDITEEQLLQLKDGGLDFLELPGSKVKELSEQQFDAFCEMLTRCKYKSDTMHLFFPADVRMTGENRDEEKLRAYMDFILPRAKRLSAKLIVFGSPAARNYPEGYPKEKAWEEIVACLKIVSEKLRPYGMVIGVEPLSKDGCNIINTVAEGAKMVRDVNRDNILLHSDFYQMALDDEPASELVKYSSLIEHLHISERDRFFPRERGEFFELFFDTVKKAGYTKTISFEGKTNDFAKDTCTGLKVMRSYLN